MEKILDIIDALAHQKGLDTDAVYGVLQTAYINTAKRILGQTVEFDAQLDKDARTYRLYQKMEVVADDDPRLADKNNESIVALSDALKVDGETEIGDELKEEISLENFGRTGVMTMHHELEKGLQKLTETAVYDTYKSKLGKLISGVVSHIDGEENTYIEMGEVRAVLPKKNRIKGERFRVGDTVKTIVWHVGVNMKEGIRIELSRTTPKFLEQLLTLEVPEISDGSITIEKCARIPGARAKIALSSQKPHVDPVGATVGTKGVRINSVSEELAGESIDVISYSPTPEIFILRAMSPAIVNNVVCHDEHKATVLIDSAQKAKAIGKAGINIRLASMLTGYEIALEESDKTTAGEQTNDSSVLSALFGD